MSVRGCLRRVMGNVVPLWLRMMAVVGILMSWQNGKDQSTLVSNSTFLDRSRVDFEIIGNITNIEVIATGMGIRDQARLQKQYGRGKWRKLKGIAQVQLANGMIQLAEIHWYEAHGIGKKEFKLKLPFLD